MLQYTYPLELTDPATIPQVDEDPLYYPNPISSVSNGTAILANAIAQIKEIIAGDGANCTKCKNALVVGQKAAQLVPTMIPDAMVALCEATKFASNATCSDNYQAGSFVSVFQTRLYRPFDQRKTSAEKDTANRVWTQHISHGGTNMCVSRPEVVVTPHSHPSNATVGRKLILDTRDKFIRKYLCSEI